MATTTHHSLVDILLQSEVAPCISVFLGPTAVGQGKQRQLRLQSLIGRIQHSLRAYELPHGEAQRLLEPLLKLAEGPEPQHPSGFSEAIFRNHELFETAMLPETVADYCSVGASFYIKPLLATSRSEEPFYVIAVSQHGARLYRADSQQAVEINVPGLAECVKDTLPSQPIDGQLQMHTGRPELHGKEGTVFFGGGGYEADKKTRLLEYMRAIDAALHPVLRLHHAPLVFAGVDYLFSIYREANTYPGLLPTALVGNPDRLSAKQVHDLSLAIAMPHLNPVRLRDRQAVEEGGHKTCKGILQVLVAAFAGQVESVFVCSDQQLWGKCDEGAEHIQIDRQQLRDSVDLLDVVARAAYCHGGRVYAVPRADMPGDEEVIALLRFS